MIDILQLEQIVIMSHNTLYTSLHDVHWTQLMIKVDCIIIQI